MQSTKKAPLAEVPTQMVAQQSTIVNFNAETLISQAITEKLPVDTMERLLAMRKELKAEWAKEQFDAAMAKFQAECPTIEKTKKVSFGTTNYSYAPLEVIVQQVKPIISSNGFSYTFDTEEEETGLTIFCMVKHTAGHMEKSKCYIEIDNASKMNVSQKSGSAITYGKRYAFCNAFGILTGDEDNDGATVEHKQPVKTGYGPSPKQKEYIENLCKEKGYTMADIKRMQEIEPRNPSQLIEYLKEAPNKNKSSIDSDGQVRDYDGKVIDVPFN